MMVYDSSPQCIVHSEQLAEMRVKVNNLEVQMTEVSADVKNLVALANQSRGGLWTGMAAASLFGGIISWIMAHWPFK